MNASPQPSVVPATSTARTGKRRSVPIAPVEDQDGAGAQRDHEHAAEVERHRAHARDLRVVLRAGPADEPEVDVAHGRRQPLDGVVAEAEEVGGDGRSRPAPRRRRAGASSAIAPSTSTACRRCRSGETVSLPWREPVVLPNPRDEVVHPRLAIGLDLDVDRRRPARRDDLAGADRRHGVAGEEGLDRRPVVRSDSGQQLERPPEAAPVPGHVQDPAARQDVAGGEVAVEADRAQEQRLAARAIGASRRRADPGEPSPRAEEAVVAHLDDLAHLPERLDREVRACPRGGTTRRGSGAS